MTMIPTETCQHTSFGRIWNTEKNNKWTWSDLSTKSYQTHDSIEEIPLSTQAIVSAQFRWNGCPCFVVEQEKSIHNCFGNDFTNVWRNWNFYEFSIDSLNLTPDTFDSIISMDSLEIPCNFQQNQTQTEFLTHKTFTMQMNYSFCDHSKRMNDVFYPCYNSTTDCLGCAARWISECDIR